MQLQYLLISAATLVPTISAISLTIGVVDNNGFKQNLAWITGQDACSTAALLSTSPANPCGHGFTIGSDSGFMLNGCGGPMWTTKGGKHQANCGKAENSQPFACNDRWKGQVKKTYQC